MSTEISASYHDVYDNAKAYALYKKLLVKYDERVLEDLIVELTPLIYKYAKYTFNLDCEQTVEDMVSHVMTSLWKYLKEGMIESPNEGEFLSHVLNHSRLRMLAGLRQLDKGSCAGLDARDYPRKSRLSPQKEYEVRSFMHSIPSMLGEFVDRHDRFRMLRVGSDGMNYMLRCILSGELPAKCILQSWLGVKKVDFCIEYYTVLCRWGLYIIRSQYKDVLVYLPKDYEMYTTEPEYENEGF